MTITLIVFGIFMLLSFCIGFYIGYLKREEKPPEIPATNAIKSFKRVIRDKAAKEEEPKSFFD